MQHLNLTLRDYLIAHAPAEPQAWFTIDTPPRPTRPIPVTVLDGLGGRRVEMKVDHDAVSKWATETQKQMLLQWPGAWADAQIALRPADERAYLFALTVADADGAHAYVVSKAAGSQTEARAAAIAAAIADRGGFGVEPLECELVQRIHVLDGDVFIRMGLLA